MNENLISLSVFKLFFFFSQASLSSHPVSKVQETIILDCAWIPSTMLEQLRDAFVHASRKYPSKQK